MLSSGDERDSTFRETVLSEKQFVFYSGAVTLLSSCMRWTGEDEGKLFRKRKKGEINLN